MKAGAFKIEAWDTTNPCMGCRGSCCRSGTLLPLSAEEMVFLSEAGTDIENHTPISPLTDKGLWVLRSACGYLIEEDGEAKCAAFDDTRRPDICSAFKAGSQACLDILQIRHG